MSDGDEDNIAPPNMQPNKDQEISPYLLKQEIKSLKKQLAKEKVDKKKFIDALDNIQFQNTQLIEDKNNLQKELELANKLIETLQKSLFCQETKRSDISQNANQQKFDFSYQLGRKASSYNHKITPKQSVDMTAKKEPFVYDFLNCQKSRIKKEYKISLYLQSPANSRADCSSIAHRSRMGQF